MALGYALSGIDEEWVGGKREELVAILYSLEQA